MIAKLKFDKYSALYLWGAFMVFFTIFEGTTFLSWTSFKLVLTDPAVYTGTLALAFLVPLATGTFDLAIGANMSLALVISTHLAVTDKTSDYAAMVIALAACAVSGFLAGFFVVKLRVDSFIATLGISQVITAAILKVSTQSITDAFSDSYRAIGKTELFGVPLFMYYLLVLAIIVWYVFEHTPIGRHMFATGGNPEAARLAGLRTDRLVWASLVASALIAGFAGIIAGWKLGNYNSTVGPGFLFPAVAAVFFGGSQFKGRPNVWGTFVALYALAWGIKGLQLMLPANSNWVQPLFQGVSLLAAVSLASHQGIIKVRKGAKGGKGDDDPSDLDLDLERGKVGNDLAETAPA